MTVGFQRIYSERKAKKSKAAAEKKMTKKQVKEAKRKAKAEKELLTFESVMAMCGIDFVWSNRC